jgi:hypothetical protein
MNHVIIIQGEPSKKTVQGVEFDLTPFIGMDVNGRTPIMLLGITSTFETEDKVSVYSSVTIGPPNRLIRSWRALQIVQRLPVLIHGTLSACWNAADLILDGEDDAAHARRLTPDNELQDAIMSARREVLDLAPSVEEMDSMISRCDTWCFLVDRAEIRRERNAKRIPRTDLVNYLILGETHCTVEK